MDVPREFGGNKVNMKMVPEEWIKRREVSLVSGCEMEKLFTLEKFPIHMMAQNREQEQYCCDLDFQIGKEDGFVQLSKIITGEKLYIDTHSNAIGGVWQKSREFMADIIIRYCGRHTDILEIGGVLGSLI